ncbi:MAG TPA: NADH-dependent [FeFe] hydrogenase, group A6 [bacterium]|nr:NADH-dependent [FeFe] hydrogenase, group A6 [bacterium]HPS30313.1 NADH-dependent [FeFe] hydrogenase, group A6 [bacterium]
MSDKVKVTIDGILVNVPADFTVLQAAQLAGVDIPTLCYHPDLRNSGNCRVCIVEIEGMPTFQPSCAFKVWDGIKVKTNTAELRKARKMIVELIASRHNTDCLRCDSNMNCELQKLTDKMNLKEIRFEIQPDFEHPMDHSNIVQRDPSKCVNCGRCIRMCNEIQTVNALEWAGRGYEKMAMTTMEKPLAETACISCGQCINVCPVGALTERDDTEKAWAFIDDPEVHTVVQTAPAIRAGIGEACGLEKGYLSAPKMFAAIKKLGFDKAMDTNFTADLTILEEGTEFLGRVTRAIKDGATDVAFPMFTSCSPGWINFIETYYPEFLPNLSTCKSPQQMFGPLAKTYYAEKAGIDPSKIRVVSIMPCTAKKFECDRPEMNASGHKDVDIVLTTREFAKMIKTANIDFATLPEIKPDDPMGISTGAADIFANTGGVMEAALRTVYEIITGDALPALLNFTPVRGLVGIKEADITIEKTAPGFEWLKGVTVKVAVVNSTGNARKLLDAIKAGEKSYHFVEVMCCPGGCIGGGGQAKPTSWAIKAKRAASIYREDESRELRKSHESPAVAQIYKDFLEKPNSHKAHHLLHTHYFSKAHLIK